MYKDYPIIFLWAFVAATAHWVILNCEIRSENKKSGFREDELFMTELPMNLNIYHCYYIKGFEMTVLSSTIRNGMDWISSNREADG
jgi:hypothetical protein